MAEATEILRSLCWFPNNCDPTGLLKQPFADAANVPQANR